DVVATGTKIIKSSNNNDPRNYVFDGQGHVVDGSQCSNKYLFNFTVAPGSNVTVKNVIFNDFAGQVIYFINTNNEVSDSSHVYLYVHNCTFNNIEPNVYGVVTIYSGIAGNPTVTSIRNFYHGSIQDCE
ncbi:MAG: hypothetical protein BZ138_08355, partial [Methanosphaera sp. rholeuAM270]